MSIYSQEQLNQAKQIIRQMAAARGISEDAIRIEMSAAIDAALAETDPQVRDTWAHSPFAHTRPTVEEFILFAAQEVGE